MVEKEANLWPIPLFNARRPKVCIQGLSTLKNASWQNFADSRSQLTARRPFVVQKWPFKALFWEIRLADTDLAATRSHRQIEAMALVFWCIEKN